MGRAGPRYEVGARHVLLLVVDDARAVAVVDDARAVAVVAGPHPCMGHSRASINRNIQIISRPMLLSLSLPPYSSTIVNQALEMTCLCRYMLYSLLSVSGQNEPLKSFKMYYIGHFCRQICV